MKIQLSIVFWGLAYGCGISQTPHYDNKNFGPRSGEGENQEPTLEVPAEEIREVPMDNPPSPSPSPSATPAKPAASGPTLDASFRAYFDLETLLRLRNGRNPDPNLGAAEESVRARFDAGDPTDSLLLKDEPTAEKLSSRTVTMNNSVLDRGTDNQSTRSGVLSYTELVGAKNCSEVFSCADNTIFKPKKGNAVTTCFYDPTGKNQAAVPFAVKGSFGASRFIKEARSYGPFLARVYAGDKVDCRKPPAQALRQEAFFADVKLAPAESLNPTRQYQDPSVTPISFGVDLSFRRSNNDNRAPYLDETLHLSRTRNLMNEEQKQIILMQVFNRSSIRQTPQQAFLAPMNGAEIELRWELCENKLVKSPKPLCKAAPSP